MKPPWLERLVRRALPERARLPERTGEAISQPMARKSWETDPFGLVNPFFRIPANENLLLNEQLVKTIPVINAAVDRLTQLVGCPAAKSDDEATLEDLMDWWENLRVNQVQTGGGNLFAGFVKSHLVYGRAHVEIIPAASGRDLFALQLIHTRTTELKPRPGRYGVDVVQPQGFGQQLVLDDALLLTAVHDIRDDNPNGNSLLMGLPFVAEIYNKLLASLKECWERYGVPIYFVKYIPPENVSDPTGTKGAAVIRDALAGLEEAQIAKANGRTKDFGAAGNFAVEILGANGEALDIEVPGRQILEQIVAKTGLPAWMLGMHWSDTERRSSVEASLLGEMIDEIREHLEPEIRYLFELRQAFVGRPFEFEICWEAPTLIDQMESAQAEKAEAEARAAALKVDERLWTLGMLPAWQVAERNAPGMEGKSEEEILTALPDLLDQPPVPVSPFGPARPPEEGGTPPVPSNPFGGRSLTYADTGANGRSSP
jgi:hypothetical protein